MARRRRVRRVSRRPRRYRRRRLYRRRRARVSRVVTTILRTQLSDLTSDAVFNQINVGYTWTLSMMTQASSYASLYDQYRCNWVKFEFVPMYNSFVTSVVQPRPILFTALDMTDATPQGATILNSSSLRKHPYGTRVVKRVWRPAVAPGVWAGGVMTGYSVKKGVWIDCVSGGVEHYGLKVYGSATWPQTYAYQVFVTASVSFKQRQ